jgi:hypothetical protein
VGHRRTVVFIYEILLPPRRIGAHEVIKRVATTSGALQHELRQDG